MSIVVTLAIVGACWTLMLLIMLAMLRAAAHSDAQIACEGDRELRLGVARVQAAGDMAPTRRFARRRKRRPEAGGRSLIRERDPSAR